MKKSITFILIMLFGIIPVLKSQVLEDSLRNLIDKSSGTEKIETRISLAQSLIFSDTQEADKVIGLAIEESQSAGYKKGEARALMVQGTLLNELGDFYAAEKVLLQTIDLATTGEWKDILCKTQLSLGTSYIRMGKYTRAAELHFEGVRLSKEINDVDMELTHLMNLGILKLQLGLLDEADEYLQGALQMSITRNDLFRQGQLYGNLGYLEYLSQNIGNSKAYHIQSLDIFLQLGDKVQAANAYNNLGYAHNLLGENDMALDQYQKALELHEELGDKAGIARVILNKARLERSKGNLRVALRLTEEALETSTNLGFNSTRMQLLFFQYEVHQLLSEFKSSLEAYKKYVQVKDSMTEQTNRAKIAGLTAQYNFEKVTNEAEISAKESAIVQLKLRQRNQLYTAIGGVLAVLALILLWNRSLLKGRLNQVKKESELRSKEHQLERQRLMLFAEKLAVKNESLENPTQEEMQVPVNNGDDHPNLEILEKLSISLVDEKDWKKFNIYFDAVYPDFYNKVATSTRVKLNLNEKRLSALIKLELTNKEIAAILNISRSSVVKAKYRLRQNMGMEETKELEDLLVNI